MCYQVNVNCRAGDIPADKKNLVIPADVRESAAQLRQDYYSKFLFAECGYPVPNSTAWKAGTDNNSCEITMSSMYDIVDFYKALSQVADFLEQTFMPDNSLYSTWKKFVDLNHGLCSWKKCQEIFEHVVSQQSVDVRLKTHEEALLNVLFTQAFKIYSGPLFEMDQWPTSTLDIYHLLKTHLTDLDTA